MDDDQRSTKFEFVLSKGVALSGSDFLGRDTLASRHARACVSPEIISRYGGPDASATASDRSGNLAGKPGGGGEAGRRGRRHLLEEKGGELERTALHAAAVFGDNPLVVRLGGHWHLFCRKALLPFGSHDSFPILEPLLHSETATPPYY